MRRPAVFLAVAFLTGCGLGLSGLIGPMVSLIGCAASAILYLAAILPSLTVRSVLRCISLAVVLVLAGAWRGGFAREGRRVQPTESSSQVSYYKGVVSSDPEWEPFSGGDGAVHSTLSVPGGEKLGMVLRGSGAKELCYGDFVTVRGRVRRSRWGRGYLSGWLVASERGNVNALTARLYSARRRAARMLESGIEDFPEQAGILKALVLGYRKGVPRETRELFIATGSLHVFAISGLHIGIACSFAVFVLRGLRVPPSRWFPFLAVFLLGYTLMTGASSSAVRACTMALVYFAGAFLGRKADSISALAFSAFLLCLISPWYLFDAGFVLSFVVAGGICVLGGALSDRLSGLSAPDPFLPAGRAKHSLLARSMSGSIAVSVSAWLVSAPLMLLLFGRLAPVGIVSNLAVVPLAFVTVLSGCCSLVFGNISIVFSDLFNHASLGLIFAMEGVINFFARAPLGALRNVHIGLTGVFAWYALLGVLTAVLRGFFAPRQETTKTV